MTRTAYTGRNRPRLFTSMPRWARVCASRTRAVATSGEQCSERSAPSHRTQLEARLPAPCRRDRRPRAGPHNDEGEFKTHACARTTRSQGAPSVSQQSSHQRALDRTIAVQLRHIATTGDVVKETARKHEMPHGAGPQSRVSRGDVAPNDGGPHLRATAGLGTRKRRDAGKNAAARRAKKEVI